ncbi:hypothetical protein ACHAPO_009967 [Fusarium lateritium]
MPTGVEEIIGLALGGTSLLAGFSGAVDGYRFLREIFDSDDTLKDVCAEWQVQSVMFIQWGESVHVDKSDDCLLHQESTLVRGAIGIVIAKVLSIQRRMEPKLKKYGIHTIQVPAVQGPSEDAFQTSSIWIKNIGQEFDKIKNVKRFKWAAKDREEFKDILTELTKCNDNLRNLIRPTQADTLRQQTVLLETIKAGQDNQSTLLSVQRDMISNPDSLIAILHHTRELQAIKPEDLAQRFVRLNEAQVSFERRHVSPEFFQTGTYRDHNGFPQPIFMEWKFIERGDGFRTQLVERIKTLGALLSLANSSEYRRPQCLGIYDDAKYEHESNGARRFAFVYSLPPTNIAVPSSLSSLLQKSEKSKARPPLGERFILAYRLASAVYMFHASHWLHKGLRADRILFPLETDITSPWITGFQFSRPAEDVSLETRRTGDPRLEMYNHPDGGSGWTKLKDIYSLGILLWEIGYWRPIYEAKFSKMSGEEVKRSLLNDLQGDSGRMWDGLMGKMYMDVVRCCLKGDFGVVSGQSEQEANVLSTLFFQKVLRELEACKA